MKITITIEDKPEEKVSVVSDPNFETMMKMITSGEELTGAQGYALFVLNKIRERAKEPTTKSPIWLPRLGRS